MLGRTSLESSKSLTSHLLAYAWLRINCESSWRRGRRQGRSKLETLNCRQLFSYKSTKNATITSFSHSGFSAILTCLSPHLVYCTIRKDAFEVMFILIFECLRPIQMVEYGNRICARSQRHYARATDSFSYGRQQYTRMAKWRRARSQEINQQDSQPLQKACLP